MKKYIRAAVPIPKLKEQFAPDMDETTFHQLIDLDPSADYDKNRGGKYCPWIFRQYNKGNLPETQYTNLKDALGFFLQNYKKYPKNDLGQYKTVDDFLTDTEAVGNRELTEKEKAKLLKKQAHHANTEDKEFIVEDGEWEVWSPKTYPGSISLAREGGTKASWCTAYEGDDYYYRRYTSQGPLYIFLNRSDPKQKYQLHWESKSWYDIDDISQGMPAFYQFCEEHPAIKRYFGLETRDGMLYRGDTCLGFDPGAKDITLPADFDYSGLRYRNRLPEGVENLNLSDGVESLPQEVFQGLKKLRSIRLPETIVSIPYEAFRDCESLETISIPDSVKSYGVRAFKFCGSLKEIKHSSNLAIVEDFCFAECSNLTTQLPDSVQYIGRDIFQNCDDINSQLIKIPASMQKIPQEAFWSASVENVDLNEATVIGSNAFRNSHITDIDLSKVVYIGSSAFRNCNNLTAIEFNPEGVRVGDYAFANSDMTGLVFIDENTNLGLSAFDDCPNLTVQWGKADEDYEFENIKLLICDEAKCPKLIAANKGYVKIETSEGKIYEVE